MRRIRQLALAAAITLLGAGAASAQGTPQPLPGATGAQPMATTAQPATPTQPPPSHFGSITVAPGASGCAGPTVGGCAPCVPDCDAKGAKSRLGRIVSAPLIGPGCASPVGCSNLAAERTFFFGSCRQFYNPGNKCGLRGGLTVGGIGGCNDPCVYGSYLNR